MCAAVCKAAGASAGTLQKAVRSQPAGAGVEALKRYCSGERGCSGKSLDAWGHPLLTFVCSRMLPCRAWENPYNTGQPLELRPDGYPARLPPNTVSGSLAPARITPAP